MKLDCAIREGQGNGKEQTICQMESFWLKEFIWMSDSWPHFMLPS